MRLVAVVILAAILGSQQARPVEPPLDLAKSTAHCIVTHGAVFGHTKVKDVDILHFGFDLDTESYPGNRAIYSISYSGENDRKGFVYVIFETLKGPNRLLRIENNATFVRKKHGIEFTGPPLGGTWTQQHIEAAIDRIESRPGKQFSMKELREEIPNLQCESYADLK